MNDKPDKVKLLESSGNEFFTLLENFAKFVLPDNLKSMLTLCCYDRVASLSQFDDVAAAEMEEFYRHTFNKDMIRANSSIENYLGIFSENQQNFMLLSGEKRLLKKVSEICLQLESDRSKDCNAIQEASDRHQVSAFETRNTELLFDAVRSWIASQLHLIEDFELKFEVDVNTRIVKSDGSVSYKMNCPVPICHRKFTVSFKANPNNYQRRTNRCNSSPTSKWHFYNIQQHLLQKHCDTESEDITSSVDTAVRLSDDQPEPIVPGKESAFTFISCDVTLPSSQPNENQLKRKDTGAVTVENILTHKRQRQVKQYDDFSLEDE